MHAIPCSDVRHDSHKRHSHHFPFFPTFSPAFFDSQLSSQLFSQLFSIVFQFFSSLLPFFQADGLSPVSPARNNDLELTKPAPVTSPTSSSPKNDVEMAGVAGAEVTSNSRAPLLELRTGELLDFVFLHFW